MYLFLQTAREKIQGFVHKTKIPVWAWSIIIILIIIRLLLPIFGLWGINWALAHKLGKYNGHIEDFNLSLYRGAYELQSLEISKIKSTAPPIISVDNIELSLAWRTLFRKEINADVTLDRAVINLIDSKEKKKQQLGTDEPGWADALKVIIPITVESFVVHDSVVNFSNPDISKTHPVHIEKIEFSAGDLQSRARQPAQELSPFTFQGLVQDHALMKAKGKIDFLAKDPRLDVRFSIEKFHPKTVNEILLTYLPFDLSKGELSLYGEAATSHGEIKGYANIFLKDVQVIAPDENYLSVKHFAFEIIGAFTNWLLQNNKDHVVAAHIPFSRSHGKFDIGTSEAFWSAIQNKSEEMKPGFDHSINLSNIESRNVTK